MEIKLSWKKILWKTAYWVFGLFVLLLVGQQALFYLTFGSWLVALPFIAFFIVVLVVQGTILGAALAGIWGPVWVKSKAPKIATRIEHHLVLPGLFLFGLRMLWHYLLEGGALWLVGACLVWSVLAFMLFLVIRDYIRRIRIQRIIEASRQMDEEDQEPIITPVRPDIHIKE